MSRFLLEQLKEHPRVLETDFQELSARIPDRISFVDCKSKLPSDIRREGCILLGERITPAGLISLAFYNEVYHLVQIESERFQREIEIAQAMVVEPHQFLEKPLEVILGTEGRREHRLRFRSSREKERVLSELADALNAAGVPQATHDGVLLIADELFTNAIYNAPTHGEGARRHAKTSRTQEIELAPGEEAEILLGATSHWLWIGARDPFGSYLYGKVLWRIYDSFQRGISEAMNMGEGGAGIGCRMMYDLCSSYTLMVDPGKQTLVGYTIPLKHAARDRETASKHIHIATTLGGKMGQLKVNENRKGAQLTLEFFGHVDEDADFNKYKLDGASDITLDLGGITAINSCGIREWIKWIRGAPTGAKLTYSKCQKAIVDQINMVGGFLPKGAVVQSFYVPYFCEGCETVTAVLLSNGKEFGSGPLKVGESIACSNCTKPANLDVVQSQYFRFIQS